MALAVNREQQQQSKSMSTEKMIEPGSMDRIVPFEHVCNFRSVGGLVTADGKHTVRHGVLFRSANFDHATEADLEKLMDTSSPATHVTTIIDLRDKGLAADEDETLVRKKYTEHGKVHRHHRKDKIFMKKEHHRIRRYKNKDPDHHCIRKYKNKDANEKEETELPTEETHESIVREEEEEELPTEEKNESSVSDNTNEEEEEQTEEAVEERNEPSDEDSTDRKEEEQTEDAVEDEKYEPSDDDSANQQEATKDAAPIHRWVNIPILSLRYKMNVVMQTPAKYKLVKNAVSDAGTGGNKAVQYVSNVLLNKQGLRGLYKDMLKNSKKTFLDALYFIVNSDKSNSAPVAIHCEHGKDRTGLVVMLVYGCIGVADNDIVADYALSQEALVPMREEMYADLVESKGLIEEFVETPPGVMRDTLVFVNDHYGGIPKYLTHIGFGPELQEKLRLQFLVERPN